MTDQNTGQKAQVKSVAAPRFGFSGLEADLSSEHYFTAYAGAKYGRVTSDEPQDSELLKLQTFCVLVLRNGATFTGQSICESKEVFDPEIGRKLARASAVAKALGYELCSVMSGVTP